MTTDIAYEDKLEEAFWKFDSTKNSVLSERDRFKNLIRAEFPAEPQEKMFHVVRCFSSYSGCEGWSTSEQIVATIKTSKNVNNKDVQKQILASIGHGDDSSSYDSWYRISFEFHPIHFKCV